VRPSPPCGAPGSSGFAYALISGSAKPALGQHRERIADGAAGRGDRVADRRRHAHDRRLARAGGGQVLSVEDHDVQIGHIGESRNPVLREARVVDPAVPEAHRLEERTADPLEDGPFDLVAEPVGIHDGAALERRDQAPDANAPGLRIELDLRARRRVAPLLAPSGDPAADTASGLLIPQPNRCAAASRTAFRRASARFFRRNASGSIPTAAASSSMCDSRAKWFAVAASARYDPCRSGDSTAWNWMD
jgi:hypothetical protein